MCADKARWTGMKQEDGGEVARYETVGGDGGSEAVIRKRKLEVDFWV